jgi:MFS family permease
MFVLFTIAALLYLGILLKQNVYFAGGPDSAGYCTEAKMIASGRMMLPVPLLGELKLAPEMIYTVTPIGWMRAPADGFMVPTYPAGLPMHQALMGKLFGWSRAPFLVAPLMAFLTLFALMLLLRELGLPIGYACGGAAIFCLIPTFVNHAVQPVSDVVATFYSILAIWLALRSRVAPAILPALAGVAFAVGVWVRPTNFLLVVPLAFALRWDLRRLAFAAAGAAPFGLALAYWNETLYGSPFSTGYGSLSAFLKPYPVCGAFQLQSIGEMVTPALAISALFVFFDRRVDGWLRAMIGVWIGSFLAFYSFYGYCDDRFLLPALPALIAGFLIVLRRATGGAGALVIALVIGVQVQSIVHEHSLLVAGHDAVYPTSVAFAEARLPKDAIVADGLMSGAFLYDGRLTIRFDVVPDAGRLAVLREAAERAHKKWYALLSVYEVTPERFDAWAPGRWVPVGMNRDVTLWRLEE